MAEKLKIISLGGLGEIGKNLYVYEFGADIIVVDTGLGVPDDDMPGVDIVIPDITYLVKNKSKIRGIVLTHGHEDHIGALPYVLKEISVPVYATPLTAGLCGIKLAEHGLEKTSEIITMHAGEQVKLGVFRVEMIRVNHSIPDSVALAIKTPIGMVIHTGDFKIDTTPVSGGMIDLARFGELGNKGVLALLMDSTNVERDGYSNSERKVGLRLDDLFRGFQSRILVTTFASNVYRIQQVMDCAAKYERHVAVTGRSMENILKVSTELGYMTIPKGLLVDVNQIKNMPPEKIVIVTTGSQGEPMSALHRIAFSGHKQIEIKPGDRVIISASAVPGNELTVSKVIDELFRRGADVIYDKSTGLHVSGHGYQEELKLMMALVKPKFMVPMHGEPRHLAIHAKVAESMGISPKYITTAEIGQVIEMTSRAIAKNGVVPSGSILVDAGGVGDIGSVVLRDRKVLSTDGMLVVNAIISREDGALITEPEITTRGFVYVKENAELLDELKTVAIDSVNAAQNLRSDVNALKSAIKSDITQYVFKKTKRNPMVLPVVTEI